VIVALPLPATAVGADGTAGASSVHCAISVTLFVVEFVKVAVGVVTPPPIHPASANPARLKVPTLGSATATPLVATVGAAVPVAPFTSKKICESVLSHWAFAVTSAVKT
jgi:hypothetical protein